MKDPESLIADYLDDALDEAGQTELSAWLKEDTVHMHRFTEAVRFDQQIRDAVHARESAQTADRFTPPPAVRESAIPSSSHPFKPTGKSNHRLARAAVWLGAFAGFGNKAAATTSTTTTILMTKSTTAAITAAILVVGGGSAILIQRSNQASEARIQELSEKKQSMQAAADVVAARPKPAPAPAPVRPVSTAKEFLTKFSDLIQNGANSQAEAVVIMKELNAMNAEALKQLILEAEQSGDTHSFAVYEIMLRLYSKSPADGTLLGVRLVANASKFERGWADTAGKAFEKWMKTDPAAAHAWYLSAVASGELIPKSIPAAGEEEYSPNRLFARYRFAALLRSNPAEAEAMIPGMMPADVAKALSIMEDSTPELVARVIGLVPPSHQVASAINTARRLVIKDFDAATKWVRSLKIDEAQRDSLLADVVITAHLNGSLKLNEVAEWTQTLKISQDERASLVIEIAQKESFIDGKGWQWDTMDQRAAWLRQTLPTDEAGKAVGQFLGSLLQYDSDLAIKAYKREAALGTSPDPQLAAAFVSALGKRGGTKNIREAHRIIETMPDGPDRENARSVIRNDSR